MPSQSGTRKKNWEDYARVLDALGESKGAEEARRNATLAHEAGA
jgi:hypothetical protein